MYLNNLIGCQITNGLNLLVSSPANNIGVHLYLIIVPEYLHQLRSDVVIALTDEYFVLILLCSGFIVFRFGESYGLRRWNWLGLWRCTHLRCLDHFIIFECFTLLYYRLINQIQELQNYIPIYLILLQVIRSIYIHHYSPSSLSLSYFQSLTYFTFISLSQLFIGLRFGDGCFSFYYYYDSDPFSTSITVFGSTSVYFITFLLYFLFNYYYLGFSHLFSLFLAYSFDYYGYCLSISVFLFYSFLSYLIAY